MQYNVQDPQGRMRVIEGPDGASDEEVIAQAQKLFGASGGMDPNTSSASSLQKIRDAIVPTQSSIAAQGVANLLPAPMSPIKHLIEAAFPPNTVQAPQNAFKQDVRTGNAQDTTLNDAAIVQGAVTAPAALRSMGALADTGLSKAGKVLEYLKSIKNAPATAEAIAPTETALSAGLSAKDALAAGQKAGQRTGSDLYDLIPKDLKPPLITAQSTADTIINEVKDLPASFQSKKILSIAGDIQNMNKASVGSIMTMNSHLKDLAINGEGVEKMYAAKLSKALMNDLQKFSDTSLAAPISQGPSLEAQDLRSLWGKNALEQSGASAEDVSAYVKPEVFKQPEGLAAKLDNSDVVNKLKVANNFYRENAQLQSHPVAQALNRARPEEMTDIIFKRGNVQDVQVAQQVLGKTSFNSQQSQFYADLKGSKDIGKALSKYSPEFIQTALKPQQFSELQKLDQFNRAVKIAIKTAKTAGVVGGMAELYHLLHR